MGAAQIAVTSLPASFTFLTASSDNGSALIVFYSKELENTKLKIEKAGGSIIKPIFSFPGGRRFHFGDPNGNEYAVWSDIDK